MDTFEQINKDSELEKMRHNKAMYEIKHRRQLLQLDCQHKWFSHSIMGRWDETICEICGVEYPGVIL